MKTRLGHNHDRLVAEPDRFVTERELPVVRSRRGDSEEQITAPTVDDAVGSG